MEPINDTTTLSAPNIWTRRLRHAWQNVRTVVIALAIALLIRYFIAQPFLVSGASMEPNLHNGNFLIIDEISYRFEEPARGDIIVFHYPNQKQEYFIKRIIGLPGESLTISGNTVRITTTTGAEHTLTEPYIKADLRTPQSREMTLGEDEYFVMGDNRGNSFDSRHWGALHEDGIVGKARVRVFPFNQFGIIESTTYSQ